ncbi:MAG: hypothetical protein B7Z31_03435 [Rhodobacterales bacterium 12-65-15]|nr:MAG: hypothetical protein B7Z31_03435 [Rhodobacterales bacterium 12-65-15]
MPAPVPDADRRTRRWLALVVFALLTFLPAFASLPVTDRDEARFTQASRQMVESGDLIDIRFQDEARHKKPIGIYWLQTAAVTLSGQGEEAPLWVYRLPSLIGAVLAVVLVAAIGGSLFGTVPGLLAAGLFAGGLVIGGEARIAKTDAALLATILASQAVLVRLYLGKAVEGQTVRRGLVFGFWLAMAAGVLIKGPIGPMVPVFTAGALVLLDRRAAWLRPLWSLWPILLALVVTLPWFVAITLRSEGAFWTGSVSADLLSKVASGQEGKGAPPGTYLVMLLFGFWPVVPLLILTLPAIWRARREPAVRFCLAWIIPVWLLYEAIPTKLFHYTLPAFPALALLAVGLLPAALSRARPWLAALAGLTVLPGLGLAAGVIYLAADPDPASPAVWLVAVALAGTLVTLAMACLAYRQDRPWRLVASLAVAGAILHGGLFAALARMPVLWPSQNAVAIAQDLAAGHGCERPALTGWGYQEPSLVWLGGRDTRLVGADTPATEVLQPDPCKVVIRARQKAEAGPPQGLSCPVVTTVDGLAIGAGRWVTLDILDCSPP